MPPDPRLHPVMRGLPSREPPLEMLDSPMRGARRVIRILVLTCIFASGWFGYQTWQDWKSANAPRNDSILDGPMHPPVLADLSGPADRETPAPGGHETSDEETSGKRKTSATAHRGEGASSLDRGSQLVSRRQYERAIPLLMEAVNTDEDNVRARYQLGVAFVGSGHLEAANEQRKALSSMDPHAARSLQTLIDNPHAARGRQR